MKPDAHAPSSSSAVVIAGLSRKARFLDGLSLGPQTSSTLRTLELDAVFEEGVVCKSLTFPEATAKFAGEFVKISRSINTNVYYYQRERYSIMNKSNASIIQFDILINRNEHACQAQRVMN